MTLYYFLSTIALYFVVFPGGNDDNTFSLDPDTGDLTLNEALDHEVRSVYELTIEAQDGDRNPPEVGPSCRCQNPSLVKLIVRVLDNNDFEVVFPSDFFSACKLNSVKPV